MKNSTIFLDELSFYSFLFILRNSSISNVIVLCKKDKLYFFFLWLLRLKGVKTKAISFFLGDYKAPSGESLFLLASRLASEFAFSESCDIVERSIILKNINLERNSVELSIARNLQTYIKYWTDRCSIVSKISRQYNTYDILIKQPLLFNSLIIDKEFKNLTITFYKCGNFHSIKLLFYFFKLKLRKLKHFIFAINQGKDCDYPIQKSNTILSLQEDDIGSENSFRRQPYWIDDNTLSEGCEHIILKHYSTSYLNVKDVGKLAKQGVHILPMYELWRHKRRVKDATVFGKIKKIKRHLSRGIFGNGTYIEKYFSILIMSTLEEAELMASLSIRHRVKVFLFSDSYFSLANAMLMIAPMMNIKTIGCQYSNLGAPNPMMISEPDVMLVFSNAYKNVFKHGYISPKSFKCYGYINNHLSQKTLRRVDTYRDKMKVSGAHFVISYFNESTQNGCFGLVNEDHDLKELHALLLLVIKNKDIGLIVKTQFLRTIPSRIYSNDPLISEAILTGRYIEAVHDSAGKIGRNNIYPAEVSLASDLCISHKYGATAGLEAAVMGARVVLLDTYGIKTIFDDVYSRADIEYQEMKILIGAIIKYKDGDLKNKSLGDWSEILHHFHCKNNKHSVEILRNEIDKCFND